MENCFDNDTMFTINEINFMELISSIFYANLANRSALSDTVFTKLIVDHTGKN